MLDWQDARARILALGSPVGTETLPLTHAAGRWSAAPVVALRNQPARDLSAMDGYAIRFADMAGPWRVIGESAAGDPFAGQVGAHEAIRIFTGAALPPGADSIVIQEEVSRDRNALTLTGEGPRERGSSVRFAGSDFERDAVLIEAGSALTPARIALAAIGGHGTLAVGRRVRVAILSTGNELVAPGIDPGADRLPGSNGPMLTVMLGDLPVEVTDFGIVPDDTEKLVWAFGRARDFDVIVTTGGASVGDHDLVRPALIEAGASIDFWKVAMRPGKPLMAGILGKAVVLGLPGNPVSAFVTATLFLKPLIAHLSGAANAAPPMISATSIVDLPAVGPRTDFVRAAWRDGGLALLPSTDSGALSHLARADALIVRAAHAPALSAGQMVDVLLLS